MSFGKFDEILSRDIGGNRGVVLRLQFDEFLAAWTLHEQGHGVSLLAAGVGEEVLGPGIHI